MNLGESLSVALGSLRANKLRSVLTMLGIIIGVAAVVALMGIGEGAQQSISGSITSNGTNLLTIIPGSSTQGGVRGGGGSAQTLTSEDAAAIASAADCPNCQLVAAEVRRQSSVVYGSQNNSYAITGTTPDYGTIRNLTIAEGDWFTTGDVTAAVNVAVLGSNVATTLFQGEDPLGKTIRINRLGFRVVGVAAPKGGTGFGSLDDGVYIPLTVAQRKLFGERQAATVGRTVSTIYVQVDDSANMAAAQTAITDLLRTRHHAITADNDFTVINQADLLSTLSGVLSVLTLFLGSIAGISLLVGGIGIMNIMLVSVTERTREIGIRKAVGAQQGDILRQFLIEAILLSVGGGLIGLAIGFGIANLVTLTGVITSVVTPGAALLAVGFSLAVGLFFGIYPARRAARLDPIVALRYE
ncbi:MAG: ABC transporter permease [Chloroflexota bacterium]|nr:ABC transporter permease [Chloroflexota bacterium]